MLTLGTKIKKLREFRSYTQEHMAEKLGISQPAYSKIETDETEISQQRLAQIAKALDVSVQDILSFDEKVLFNFISSASACGYYNSNVTNYGINDNERKLYEENIKLLHERIRTLEEKNEYLQKELERQKSGK